MLQLEPICRSVQGEDEYTLKDDCTYSAYTALEAYLSQLSVLITIALGSRSASPYPSF